MIEVVASWDDGAKQDVIAANLMAKYEIEAIFYWPALPLHQTNSGKFLNPLTPEQAQQIAAQFEIGAHTVTHPHLTKVTEERAWDEIYQSRKMLQEQFDQSVESFCYPRGYANHEIKQMVREAGFTNARNVIVGSLEEAIDPIWTPTTVHVGCNRREYNGRTWQQFAHDKWLEALELAHRGKPVIYHLWGHSWELDKEKDGWADLEQLLKVIT